PTYGTGPHTGWMAPSGPGRPYYLNSRPSAVLEAHFVECLSLVGGRHQRPINCHHNLVVVGVERFRLFTGSALWLPALTGVLTPMHGSAHVDTVDSVGPRYPVDERQGRGAVGLREGPAAVLRASKPVLCGGQNDLRIL